MKKCDNIQRRPSHLVPVKRVAKDGRRAPRHVNIIPSLLLSNVRSLFNKIDEIAMLLAQHQPHLAVITETWLDDDTPNAPLLLPNYNVFRQDRKKGKGGGLLCYVYHDFSCEVIDICEISSVKSDSEFLCLFIRELTCHFIFVSSILE